MSICILGLGHVGLTLAVSLAKVSPPVYGIEVDKNKVKQLSDGNPTFFELGLKSLLKEVTSNDSFKISSEITQDIADNVDTYIICIGTPLDSKTNTPILSHLEKVVNTLSNVLKKGDLIIIRSTVTVGTTQKMIKKKIEDSTKLQFGIDFFLASAPERTVEGNALKELKNLPQIVGSTDTHSIDKTGSIFNKLTKTIIRVSSFDAAEVIKLLDNTSRDVNIAMANQFGLICESLGLKSSEIIEAANFGYGRNRIWAAGAGVGGPCLVKDPYFLMESVKGKIDTSLITLARKINDSMPLHVLSLIDEIFVELQRHIKDSKILILGFAFKGRPVTDDTRFSPTIPVAESLKNKGAILFGYDPAVSQENISKICAKPITLEEMDDFDCIVIMNNNEEFLNIDYGKFINMNKKVGLLDGWEILDNNYIKQLGFVYRGVGVGQ